MFRKLVLAVLAVASATTMADAAGKKATKPKSNEALVVLGEQRIDLSGSGITIDVSGAAGAYRGIRVISKRGKADLKRVQVIYNDGAVHNEDRTIRLLTGERTRPINQGKTDRFIDKINITNKVGNGTAVLQIIGIQTASGAAQKRSAPVTGDITQAPTDVQPTTEKPGTVDGNDVMFGYQNVGFGIDRDTIKVGGDLGKFDRIRMRVLGNDIHINNLKVIYLDGDQQDLAVDADVKANSRTGWFELKGDRFIREIQMSYRSRPSFKGRARVEVTGQFADGWLGAGGEGRKFNEGWVLLGAQTAGFTGFDTDSITVGKNEGGFSRLRVEAKDRAITLKEIRVKYYSGPDEVFTMRERVDPGKPYGPLEFKGGKAAIKSIEAKYRSRFDLLGGLRKALDGNPAVVQIWGQH